MPETKAKRLGGFKKLLLIAAGLIVLAIAGGWFWYRYTFPYGCSHACSKGLGLTLRVYAGDHDGWLPHGENTPEASLALFAKTDTNSALGLLGGKNVPRQVVQTALTKNGSFGPNTCGWHYVEGLREDDDPQIAVAWDKVVGLSHNGQRRAGVEHEVVLLDGSTTLIGKREWPQFVADLKERLANVMASRETNAPPIRWSDEETLGPNRFSPVRR